MKVKSTDQCPFWQCKSKWGMFIPVRQRLATSQIWAHSDFDTNFPLLFSPGSKLREASSLIHIITWGVRTVFTWLSMLLSLSLSLASVQSSATSSTSDLQGPFTFWTVGQTFKSEYNLRANYLSKFSQAAIPSKSLKPAIYWIRSLRNWD